ncbi:Cytochrome c4 [hydrothermal vent metagenome]|uniref:Cytochrome c4 n=1 Tax=hydrothermal vent metagenome TaxID=652676 RepID=A0A3B0ZKG5_9ZZZZ
MKKYIAVLVMSLVPGVSSSLYAGGGHGEHKKADPAAMKAKAEAAAKARAAVISNGQALVKSKGCGGCHGVDGNSVIAANPKLAGQNAAYLLKQLQNFKLQDKNGKPLTGKLLIGKRYDGSKNGKYGVSPGIMNGQVATLSQDEMLSLATYFSVQKLKPGKSELAQKTLGEKIYIGGNVGTGVPACIGCHGPAGAGNNAALYPAIGGQHAAYTEAQLKHFRSAALVWLAHNKKDAPMARAGRKNDKGHRMQAVVLRMTDVEIKAVASYLQGLRGTQ